MIESHAPSAPSSPSSSDSRHARTSASPRPSPSSPLRAHAQQHAQQHAQLHAEQHERWTRELEAALRCSVELRWTRARSSVMRMSRRGSWSHAPRIDVALADFFRAAPLEIRAATADWLRSGRRARGACRRLDEWIDAQLAQLPRRELRAATLRARGAVHDLAQLARELHDEGHLAAYLDHARTPRLGWGRGAGSRARRSLRLGSCSSHGDAIRIHPVLDQAAVPAYFVRAVLFHELLHVAFPTRRDDDGRRVHHGDAFRRAERAFADFERARRWEHAHIDALIRSARTGKPLALPRVERDASRPGATQQGAAQQGTARGGARFAPEIDAARDVDAPNRTRPVRPPRATRGVARLVQSLLFD